MEDNVVSKERGTFQDEYPDSCEHGWSNWRMCPKCADTCPHCGKVRMSEQERIRQSKEQ